MSKKIISYYVEVNGIRYKRVYAFLPIRMGCSNCDLNGLCGTVEMGIPCCGYRDYFIKE